MTALQTVETVELLVMTPSDALFVTGAEWRIRIPASLVPGASVVRSQSTEQTPLSSLVATRRCVLRDEDPIDRLVPPCALNERRSV